MGYEGRGIEDNREKRTTFLNISSFFVDFCDSAFLYPFPDVWYPSAFIAHSPLFFRESLLISFSTLVACILYWNDDVCDGVGQAAYRFLVSIVWRWRPAAFQWSCSVLHCMPLPLFLKFSLNPNKQTKQKNC